MPIIQAPAHELDTLNTVVYHLTLYQAEKVMAGKSHDKGMRAHKITVRAMWRIPVAELHVCTFIEIADSLRATAVPACSAECAY